MSDDHVYKVIELVGSSADGLEDAIDNALERANETVKHLRWFKVEEIRGHIEGGEVGHYQVVLKVGFSLEDAHAG